MTQNLMKTGYV